MDATIEKIALAPGARVEAGDLLIVLKPAAA
jgi:biotin carboxyl carrier protein